MSQLMFQSKAQTFLIFIELTLINFSALTSSPFHLRFKAVPSPFQLPFRERTQSEGTALTVQGMKAIHTHISWKSHWLSLVCSFTCTRLEVASTNGHIMMWQERKVAIIMAHN